MTLSLLLFALGVGLISLLLMMSEQIEEKFENNLADIDMVVGAKGSPLQLILCNMYHIDAPTGNVSINEIKPFLNPRHPLIRFSVPVSVGDNHKGYRIVGTNHLFIDSLYNGTLAKGKRWERDFEVNIGAAVADDLGLAIGDRFFSAHGLIDDGINIHDDGEGFEVVGIFEPSGTVLDQLILTNTQSIWKVHDHEDHDHGEHDHKEGANKGHDHEGHDHEGHDHEGHDHEGHDHEGHDHEGHDHEDHAHKGHDHEDHAHKGHDHEDHAHKGHDHEGHDHEGHDHEGHDHEGHDHEGHDHEGHDHEGHD
ncbi:MAG: ABC transporter permease, partial [Bacteroidota bacterium]